MINKITLICTFVLMGFISSEAQVSKQVVIEHFTNTRCGICGSRNPDLIRNLDQNREVLHLAVHPSRPYRNCLLNNHNGAENDARTNYYGVFGSTPRIVIQGQVISSGTSFGSSMLFTDYMNQTSPFSLTVTTLKSDADSLTAMIVLKTEATHATSSLNLYIPAVEDTVFYNAPNGEREHHDVFRKVLVDELVSPAMAVGDSIILYARTATHADWDANQMYVMAIAQDAATKEVIQSGASSLLKEDNVTASVSNLLSPSSVNIFPNPATTSLSINLTDESSATIQLLNSTGKELSNQTIGSQSTLDITTLPQGMYWLKVSTPKGYLVRKIVKL